MMGLHSKQRGKIAGVVELRCSASCNTAVENGHGYGRADLDGFQ